jgi:hypothetical protein
MLSILNGSFSPQIVLLLTAVAVAAIIMEQEITRLGGSS